MVKRLASHSFRPLGRQGFTLIELLVVLTVLAVLTAIVAPRYLERVQDARETALRQDLLEMRKTLDRFYRDRQRYPNDLSELVQLRYIREIPIDPITQKKETWVLIEAGSGGILDIKSGASGNGREGSAYVTW